MKISALETQKKWFNQKLDDLEEVITDYKDSCSTYGPVSTKEEIRQCERYERFRDQLRAISKKSDHAFIRNKALTALGVSKSTERFLPLLENRLYAMYVTQKGKVDEYVENPETHNWHDNRELNYKEEDVEWRIDNIGPFRMRRIDTLINIEEFYKMNKKQEFYSLLRLAYLDNDVREVRESAGVILGYSDARIRLNNLFFNFKNRKERYGEVYTLNMLTITKRDDLRPDEYLDRKARLEEYERKRRCIR